MQYHKKIIISIVFVILALAIAYTVEAYEVMTRLNKVIRLHVVANSDNYCDQQLKYKVRNHIITSFNQEFEKPTPRKKAQK